MPTAVVALLPCCRHPSQSARTTASTSRKRHGSMTQTVVVALRHLWSCQRASARDYCKYEPQAAWQYDANCGGCTPSLLEEYYAQTPGPCASWCQYEGPATWPYDPNCGGCTKANIANRTTPSCFSYCQYVGTGVWQYNPDCQACKLSQLIQDSKEAKESMGECKDYCKYEPQAAWQYDANCGGCTPSLLQESKWKLPGHTSDSQVCQPVDECCKLYCRQVPQSDYQYDVNCMGCGTYLFQESRGQCKDYCQYEPPDRLAVWCQLRWLHSFLVAGIQGRVQGLLQIRAASCMAVWCQLWWMHTIALGGVLRSDTRKLCKLVSVWGAWHVAIWSKLRRLHPRDNCQQDRPNLCQLLPECWRGGLAIQSWLPSLQVIAVDPRLQGKLRQLLPIWAPECLAVWCQLWWLHSFLVAGIKVEVAGAHPQIPRVCQPVDECCKLHCRELGQTDWQYDVNCMGCGTYLFQESRGQCKDYCKYEPSTVWQYDANCGACTTSLLQGEKGECKDYCKYEPQAAWQYDANCGGCTPALAQTAASKARGGTASVITSVEWAQHARLLLGWPCCH